MKDGIENIKKTFPTAKTHQLQQTITVRSTNPELHIVLSQYKDVFNYIEPACLDVFPDYEPNDITALAAQARTHLGLIKTTEAWDITKVTTELLLAYRIIV